MPLDQPAAVRTYTRAVADIRAALANLDEFGGSLPAADPDGEVPNIDFGQLADLLVLRAVLGEASLQAEKISK